MKLLVVNPNTTATMTEKIADVARSVARADTEIIATNPVNGPASIQGYLDGVTCLPGLIEEVNAHPEADAILVACFDDTGVDALRCLTDAPVIGIGEAAYHAASMIAPKFGVVTTLSRSVPGLETNLLKYGLAQKCTGVRATNIPVLELENGNSVNSDTIRNEIRLSIEEDGAEAIVLGCAGMADLMKRLSSEFGLPVVDGVACGVTLTEALVGASLKTSKVGSYALD